MQANWWLQDANARQSEPNDTQAEWARKITDKKIIEQHRQQSLQESRCQDHFVSLQQHKDNVTKSLQSLNHCSHHLPTNVFHCICSEGLLRGLHHADAIVRLAFFWQTCHLHCQLRQVPCCRQAVPQRSSQSMKSCYKTRGSPRAPCAPSNTRKPLRSNKDPRQAVKLQHFLNSKQLKHLVACG